MAQQEFTIDIVGDSAYSYTRFGTLTEVIPAQAEQKLEFDIYHGPGGMQIEVSVGSFSDNYAGVARRVIDNFRTQNNTGSFGVSNPLTGVIRRFQNPFNDLPTSLVVDLEIDVVTPPHHPATWPQQPVKVELYRPSESSPVKVWDLGSELTPFQYRELKFPIQDATDDGIVALPNLEVMKKYGWWRCVVTVGPVNSFIYFSSASFIKKVQEKEMKLTNRWLNHAFYNVLSAVTPKASINGNHITVSLLEEVSHSADFAEVTVDEYVDFLENDNKVELLSANARATYGKELIKLVKDDRDKARVQRDGFLPSSIEWYVANQRYQKQREEYEKVTRLVLNDDLVVRLTPLFSNPLIKFGKSIVSGEISWKKEPIIYLSLRLGYAYVDLGFEVNNLSLLPSIVMSFVGNTRLKDFVNESIEKVLTGNFNKVKKYVNEGLARAAGKDVRFISAKANSKGWNITYAELGFPLRAPTALERIRQSSLPGQLNVEVPENGELLLTTDGDAPGGTNGGTPVSTGRGNYPAEFIVNSENGALEKLDKIKTIFVIMMENRSFDHFLGFLGKEYPDRGYTCFNETHTNPGAGNFVGPLTMVSATSLFTGSGIDIHETPISPDHGFNGVSEQLGDGSGREEGYGTGEMQGFTRNIVKRFAEEGSNVNRPDSTPRFENPSLVMTYYEKEQLKTYDFIANQFKILDHWFCAHPGGTWPNRIATITGKLMSLHNFSINDDRIGYFNERTIFDVLSDAGVDWRYYEYNASIMRIFDKYRTNDKNVIPILGDKSVPDEDDTLSPLDDQLLAIDDLLAQDVLPRVVFIEPRFSDAPPLASACDDLAPTNILHGQDFIKKVCKKLFESNHWENVSLMITYDEHGGFYDHVAPPGTSEDRTNYGPVDKIYDKKDDNDIDGPTYMGVRVPALLVSPYVSPESVAHQVFDHTSILKTILVHNREKIPNHIFTSFSSRVNKAEHLGSVLDLDTPRPAPEWPEEEDQRTETAASGILSYYLKRSIDEYDYHEALRNIFNPVRK